MLEIILLVYLCTKMGGLLRDEKGWERTFWMQLSVVLIYFVSLFLGATGYGIFVAVTQGQAALNSIGWSAYLAGYIGVIFGVGVFFLFARSLPVRQPSEIPNT